MRLADLANRYVADHAPWEIARDADAAALSCRRCALRAINHFRLLTVLLKPVVPQLAAPRGEVPGRRPAAVGGPRAAAAGGTPHQSL